MRTSYSCFIFTRIHHPWAAITLEIGRERRDGNTIEPAIHGFLKCAVIWQQSVSDLLSHEWPTQMILLPHCVSDKLNNDDGRGTTSRVI